MVEVEEGGIPRAVVRSCPQISTCTLDRVVIEIRSPHGRAYLLCILNISIIECVFIIYYMSLLTTETFPGYLSSSLQEL